MARDPSYNRLSPHSVAQPAAAFPVSTAFAGFLPPTSNTTYTPNQFFDVCLPHCSRSAIRLVGYFIRRTLGWCDQYGRPQEDQIEISFRELTFRTGVSRDRLRGALDEAIAGHFIECVREGRPSTARDAGQSAIYRLRWHDSSEYQKDPADFRGFFEREGNRTDIPNQYFDHILPTEPLSVIKVVGAVIRSSIGFAARRGARRQWTALSYSQIQHFTRLKSRKELALALRMALDRRYVARLEDGCFTPAKAEQRSAVYALRWTDSWLGHQSGQISPPEKFGLNRSEIPTSTGPKSIPEDRSEIPTTLKTKLLNETGKVAPQPQQSMASRRSFNPAQIDGEGEGGAFRLSGAIRDRFEQGESPSKVRSSELLTEGSEKACADFVRHFYAGFHGHAGEPVNQPSLRELELASTLVQRLFVLGEGRGGGPRWGRRLGELARSQRNPLAAFSLAFRQCGDALLAEASRELQQRQEQELEQRRAEHRERHLPTYLAFLRNEETRLMSSAADDYAAFLRLRAAELEQLQRNLAPWAVEMARDHSTERHRLRALQGRFRLPGFWQWDAEHHDYPFNPKP